MSYKLSREERKFLEEQRERLEKIIEINKEILEKFRNDAVIKKYWLHVQTQYELWRLEEANENAEQALELLVSPSYESREDFLEAGRQACVLVGEMLEEAHDEGEVELMKKAFKAGYFRGLRAELESGLMRAREEKEKKENGRV